MLFAMAGGGWEERGPFRLRVVSQAAAGSFRDSANVEIVEIEWAEPVRKPVGIVLPLIGLVLSLIVASSASVQRSRITEDGHRLDMFFFAGVALTFAFALLTIHRYRRVVDARRPRRRKLRITPATVELHLPSGRVDHAIESALVETGECEGRHQAALVADGVRTVLYESLHEREVTWLVTRVREALSRR